MFRDAGEVADSLTGIHNAMVKCPFVVNRSYIHKGVQVPPQDSSQASGEAMQWVLLYLAIGHDRFY
jgi:hypothetical protein